ncbi:Acyltransferase [Gammaproteobacteria bacterium]
MSILRILFERYKYFYFSLRSRRAQLRIAQSSRLLRGFGVHFLTHPDNRIYLSVGERCVLNSSITFESTDGFVSIGNRTYIGHGAQIISRNRIEIGADVTMAWGITIYDHNSHSFDWRQRARVVDHFYRTYGTGRCFEELDWSDVKSAPIVIGDRVWIGFDAVILKGVTIGEGAVIGARSVVSRNVEPYTVVAGNPATLIRRIKPPVQDASPDAI